MPGGFHPPAAVILAWPKPNYTDPQAKGNELLVITIICMTLSTAAVLARLWVQIRHQKKLRVDDLMLVICMVPTIGIGALLILTETKFRWFRHVWDLPRKDIVGRQYHSWITQLLFILSTTFSKLSALLLYKRVVAGSLSPTSIFLVNTAIVGQSAYGIIFAFVGIFQCRPVNAYWLQFSYPHPYTEKFSCYYEGTVPLANACVSVVTDFLTALLPICLFLQMQIPKRDKYALAAIFGVAFIVCIAGTVRTVIVHRIFYESYDNTWVSHNLWAWYYVETSLLVICSAIPPLRVYLKRIFGGSKSDSDHTPAVNTFHRKRAIDGSDPADSSNGRASTDSIVLHEVEHCKV
ncbi:Uncharacterized protein BP5553_10369 [Venustampulla echinocandica]|uniref:Rhodopsin domain-containing protein n=1 Tax=Venustampulla echinocandica TaxID=2656787 RepID=A0A370TA34_9HELO|nr:Uncharacterized protein BP5553_10369 [Venustampulla echinocandica]RDL30491.1 Uncharacterized protein BP5553_10369 [Venustampulla echinocandica]